MVDNIQSKMEQKTLNMTKKSYSDCKYYYSVTSIHLYGLCFRQWGKQVLDMAHFLWLVQIFNNKWPDCIKKTHICLNWISKWFNNKLNVLVSCFKKFHSEHIYTSFNMIPVIHFPIIWFTPNSNHLLDIFSSFMKTITNEPYFFEREIFQLS